MPRLTVKALALEDIFQDIARVHLDHRIGSSAGKVVVLTAKGQKVRALARGVPKDDRTAIFLDEATRGKLGVSLHEEVDFIIQPADTLDDLLWAWSATNAMPRIGARLAVLSLILGLVGLMLGIISLAK